MVDNADTHLKQHDNEIESIRVVASEFAVIILAAGLSSRMGNTNKLLLDVNGQSLLQRCVSVVKEAGVGEIIVVLGHDQDNTIREIADIDVQHVVNEQYETGQMSSVQCGLESLSGSKKATLICLSDQPLLNTGHLKQLMWAFENLPQDKQIVIPMYNNQRGNPVVLSDKVCERVLQQGGNPGCRRYIDKNPELVSWVSFDDPAFIIDIDTPDEYTTLCNSHTFD